VQAGETLELANTIRHCFALKFHDLLGPDKRFWRITQQALASPPVVCARPRDGCVPTLPNHTT
jgi:hypothetical protein